MKRILTLFLLSMLGMFFWASFANEEESVDSESPLVKEIPSRNTTSRVLWPLEPKAPETVIISKYTTSASTPNTRKYQVRFGDSFHQILSELELPEDQVNHLAYEISKTINLNEFKVGNVYRVKYDQDKQIPGSLIYDLEDRKELCINFKTNEVKIQVKEVSILVKTLRSPINSSLAQTVLTHKAPEDLADKILSAFAWKIDFRHLQKGDHFQVIYEEERADGQAIGTRNILAITFNHEGKTYAAYGFDNGNGHELFDANGHNMSHAPLQFEMITSLYAQKRFHPTQRRYKAHYGMDFEANLGTPIEAIQDGVITRAQYGRANGNNVKIKHNNKLSTQYLHMSQIDSSIHVGDAVKQGQVIGYVGNTGWSSGPHLCLRVWYNGSQRDPLEFDFPRREDIKPANLPEFQQMVRRLDYDLTHPL